jgi:putative MATE family efflux protein
MWLMVASAGGNVILDPFLILGWGPFPAMGTRGAAWATLIARAGATAAGIYVLLRGGFGVRLYPRDLRPDPAALGKLLSIGYPATIDGWARSFAAVVMAAFVTPFGTAAVAAYGIGIRLMSVTWSVAGAVGQATATGVGQNLGANTPDRAWRVTYVATAGTMALLGTAAGICLLVPEFMIGIFVDNPAVISEGVGFLYIIAPFWAAFGGTMVIQGAFRGAGQTKVAMALSFLSRWAFRVPIAIFVAFSTVVIPRTGVTIPTLGIGIGVEGIWVAFAVGAILSFLIAVFWFRRGRWTDSIIDESPPAGAVDTELADDEIVRDVD